MAMGLHDGVYSLRSASMETGSHPADVLVEVKQATLAAGTVEVPTIFEDGQIIGVIITHCNNASVNSTQALSTDMVVSTGAITVVGPTASTAVVTVAIFGRPKVI